MNSRVRFLTITLALLVLAFCFGIWLGGHPERLPTGIRQALIEEDRSLRAELESVIERRYFEEVDPQKFEDGSLEGIVRALDDDFSHYFSPDDAALLQEQLRGNFEGVGMTIEEDKGGLRVLGVIDGTPAERVGIHPGDIVTRVDNKSIAGEPADVAASKIKGPAGTKVELTVVDPKTGKDRVVNPERASIDVPPVESEVLERGGHKVGVIRLLTFSEGVHGKLAAEVQELRSKGVEGFILDMRGNGGGLLNEGVLVASVFIEDGPIVSTRGRTEPERKYDALGTAVDTETPMVVLVSGGTASAAEIVAGALRDRGRAETVVGEKTFGKGVFQEVIPVSNGGLVNLTVGSFYLPEGENLAENGIRPQVKARDNLRTKRDEALPTALKELVDSLDG
jgi:carboxyl-terminal processing protease